MTILSYMLLPFAFIYGLGIRFRNIAYDKGWFKSVEAPMQVISVGNLSAGGTGKTPMVEWIVRHLQAHGIEPAVLSRGYGRETNGFRVVHADSTASDCGDEPVQMARSLGTTIAVCEDRVQGALKLEALYKPPVIVLDDGFQHRAIRRTIDLVLLDASRPPHRDFLLPAGRLREPRSAMRRASMVVFSKVSGAAQLQALKAQYADLKPGFSTLVPQRLVSFDGANTETIPSLKGRVIVAFAGIGNPGFFETQLKECGATITAFHAFGDHQQVGTEALARIAGQAGNGWVVTTAKDFARLSASEVANLLDKFPATSFFYVETEVKWLEGQERLEALLAQKIKNYA